MKRSMDRPEDIPRVDSPSSIAAKYATYKKLRAATFFFILFLLIGILFIAMTVISEEYFCLGALFIFLAIIAISYVLEERS